jgi:hypothetical protein
VPESAPNTLSRRGIVQSITDSASELEHRFQPVTDFDKDGCYYTAAVGADGTKNGGLGPGQGVPPGCLASTCRDRNRLENNNVYSRSRCNNGWCAIMYEYYFEKDQIVCGSFAGGHRHDWENIVVFVKDDQVKRVAPSCHGGYGGATNTPRIKDGVRAKVVYHKDSGRTHCLRMANEADDKVENHTGDWFLGRLIGWNNWPNEGLRNTAMRPSYFHNGVFHSLVEVVDFYNTRDTNPARWYPQRDGTVQPFDDLPSALRANVTHQPPFGTQAATRPPMNAREVSDLICFLETLTDGHVPGTPSRGPCRN